MTSMIFFIVSITSIIGITEGAVEVYSNTKWHNNHIKKLTGKLSRSKLQTMIVPEYYGLDIWTMLPLQPRLEAVDPAQTLSSNQTITTKPIANQHDGGRRNRRQAIESNNVNGKDYGFNSVVSLTSTGLSLNANGNYVYPMSIENWTFRQPKWVKMNQIRKSTFKNRRRRSASDEKISSETKISSTPDPIINSNENKMSAIKCLLSLSLPVSLPTQCIQLFLNL